MLQRLGNVIYWTNSGAAVLFFLYGLLVAVNEVPDGRIFAEALRRAECEPREALFVGDSLPQDIAGANRAGLRSVLLWHRGDRQPSFDVAKPTHVIRRIPEVLDLLS